MNNEKVSKFLSYILRHKPESIGITLDNNGWADVDDIIENSATGKYPVTYEQIVEVVKTCDKQRYTLDENLRRIRANQGHSVKVDVELEEKLPPLILYHGTADRFCEMIEKEGLKPMSRQHVHLSADLETAMKVGKRHGKVVIYTVASRAMSENGEKFYQSVNGVWLVDHVPAKFLNRLSKH